MKKKKNKVGILTLASIFLSKIVYANRMVDVVQPEYGVYTPTPKLYGIIPTTPSDPSIIENSNVLVTIGKITIIPVVLLVGIFTIVKITGRKKKNTKEEKENEEKK